MKIPKNTSRFLALSALLLLLGVLSSAIAYAQENVIYLPHISSGTGPDGEGQTPTPTSTSTPVSQPVWEYGYLAKNQVWYPLPDVPVCWVNPSDEDSDERQWVRQRISDTWEHHSSIRFVGWDQCPVENDERRIRIKIADVGPHVKTLGHAIRKHDEGMVLNFTFNNWNTDGCATPENNRKYCIEAIAVHEFGHALAFAHEQNRPDTPGWCTGQEQGSNGDIIVGVWDVHSVMNYCNPTWNNGGKLSDGDILTVQTFYGAPPTPTPTNTPTATPTSTKLPTVTPTPTATPVIRRWNISGQMKIVDDETFGGDERGTHQFTDSLTLTQSRNIQTYVIKRCTGAEVRGEIQLQVSLETDGVLRVTGTLYYYEGTSCSTNDLERTQDINYTLYPGQSIPIDIRLSDSDGSVDFEFTMSNR